MITLYFSGTGNTRYIAELFSQKMAVSCYSIEDKVSFPLLIESHDTIVFSYPIYGSRVPLIMRRFVTTHLSMLKGKRTVVLVTQMAFSGDGARALCDLFPAGHIQVVYAEHFKMPNNICNIPFFQQTSDKGISDCLSSAERKMDIVCRDLKAGIVKKRGFSAGSRLLGKIQGIPWQKDSRSSLAVEGSLEYRALQSIKISSDCNLCGICVDDCPMQNLLIENGAVGHLGNCTICYRCINNCPQKAITILFHNKPKWQYRGIVAR
ncbi:MAG: EFR1 family ferrodoxin [Coriobacteriia bacterium]|nr:EFR1 family ferrodoxin [Coriobacteriia bacterium]